MNNSRFFYLSILIFACLFCGCSKEQQEEAIELPSIIVLDNDSINVSFEGNEALEIRVKTDVEKLTIGIEGNVPWISVTTPNTIKSTKTEILCFKVNENQTTQTRQAKIIIRDKNPANFNLYKEFTINQAGRIPGIYTAEDLITLGSELNKKKELRSFNILSSYGVYNDHEQKWYFIQKRDINLNPNLNIHVEKIDKRQIKISYTGEISNKWIPIGHSDEYYINKVMFEDVYDGGGFKIENLFIEGKYRFSGLFGLIENARIKNVYISNGCNNSYYKDYFGFAGSLCAQSINSSVENVHSTMIMNNQHNMTGGIIGYGENTVIKSSSFEKSYILPAPIIESSTNTGVNCGGIIGYSNNTIVENCQLISVNIRLSGGTVGGIIGLSNGGVDRVSNCTSDAIIWAEKDERQLIVGGIIGDTNTCIVSHSETTGSIIFSGDRYFPAYGGIVGRVHLNSVIAGCQNKMLISNELPSMYNSGNIGGILGDVDSSQMSETSTNLIIGCCNSGKIDTQKLEWLIAGGIIGYGKGTSIIGCYNVAQLNTHERTSGSIAGSNDSDRIKGTFWLVNTCSRAIGLFGDGTDPTYEKTDAELKSQSIVNQLNDAIKNWNIQNQDKAYNIQFQFIPNDYPQLKM